MCEKMMQHDLRLNASEGEEFNILRPTICKKNRRVQQVHFDSADLKLETLTRIATECP